MNYSDWLKKARNDILAMEAILAYPETPPTDAACYHAQQVAEKSLKAFLIAKAQKLLSTDKLATLLNECAILDVSFTAFRDQVKNLDRISVATSINFPILKVREAAVQSKEIYNFVRERLEPTFA